MNPKAVFTCTLTGVLTDPVKQPAPVAPEEIAKAVEQAFNAGRYSYPKARLEGAWTWPPLPFENSFEKSRKYFDVMDTREIDPEFEHFHTGIVM